MNRMTCACIGMLLPIVANAKSDGWEWAVGFGGALNLPQSLSIEMDSGETIDLGTVNYDTKPFNSPPYYALRAARWQDSKAWELEFIHHKIYLQSKYLNDRVTNFEISDGYNLLYGNYAAEITKGWITRFGVGAVIVHPDVTVDGVRSHGGYQWRGITTQLALEREFPLSDAVIFSAEGKLTYSYAKANFTFGSATVPNTALHLLAMVKFAP